MYAMVDMEMDDEDQYDAPVLCNEGDRPKYPYGLRICLTDKEMAKLGLDAADAFVGGIVHLHALARVTSVSINETENREGESSDNARIELQIVALNVESEDEENEMADDEAEESTYIFGR